MRRRRVSANRCLQQLKAALNHAFNDGKMSSDLAWRKVKVFRGAEAARVRYLTIAECKRLVNACESSFRNLVRAALETGARYSELARLRVADYNRDIGAVAIRAGKTSTPRHIILTADGMSFFEQLSAGRTGNDLMLPKSDGSAWLKSHQIRPMHAACKHASISPPLNFHGLRHCWASHATMGGLPLLVVAKNLGHPDTRMVETHYGHSRRPTLPTRSARRAALRQGEIECAGAAMNKRLFKQYAFPPLIDGGKATASTRSTFAAKTDGYRKVVERRYAQALGFAIDNPDASSTRDRETFTRNSVARGQAGNRRSRRPTLEKIPALEILHTYVAPQRSVGYPLASFL